jgi:hypothetical protein
MRIIFFSVKPSAFEIEPWQYSCVASSHKLGRTLVLYTLEYCGETRVASVLWTTSTHVERLTALRSLTTLNNAMTR